MSELPAKFWMNTDTWDIVPLNGARSTVHLQAVQANPRKFGVSKDDLIRLEEHEVMTKVFSNGWVRCAAEGTEAFSVETIYINEASKTIRHLLDQGHWFTDVFWDFIYTPTPSTTSNAVRLEGHEQIERFAQRGLLPPKYKDLKMRKRRVSTNHDPKPGLGTGGLAGHLHARLESVITEARRRTGPVTDVTPEEDRNLPVTGSRTIANTRQPGGLVVQAKKVNWIPLMRLPTAMLRHVKEMFEPFFQQMLGAGMDRISATSSMPMAGSRPADVEALWDYLIQNGQVEDNFSMNDFEIAPGYQVPDAKVVTCEGRKFVLMEETYPGMPVFKTIYVVSGNIALPGDRPRVANRAPRQIAREGAGQSAVPFGRRPRRRKSS